MEEGAPIWYLTECWFGLPNKTFKTILVLMAVALVPCGHRAPQAVGTEALRV